MTEASDDELRARFDALRAADLRAAPGFRTVLDRAARPRPEIERPSHRWGLYATLSIAAAALLAVGLARVSRRLKFVAEPLSTWSSPTASLLRTPGSALLTSPTLMPSALDHLSNSLAQREGN